MDLATYTLADCRSLCQSLHLQAGTRGVGVNYNVYKSRYGLKEKTVLELDKSLEHFEDADYHQRMCVKKFFSLSVDIFFVCKHD